MATSDTEANVEPSATAGGASGLPPPSIAYSGASRVSVITNQVGGNSGVRIDGDPTSGAFALVRYQMPVSGTHVTAQLTVEAAPGAAFQCALAGSGSGYSTRKLTLQREPGSDQLQAHSSTGQVACGTLGSAPATIALVFDGDSHTFDVRIDGAATACTDLPTPFVPPVVGFSIMDPSNAGYGGQVQLTNLSVF